MLQSGKAIRRLSHTRCNVKYEMDGDVPDETIPPETDETALEEPVQPEGDASVDVQATSQIIASEATTAYSYIYADGQLQQEKVTTGGKTETHTFFYDSTGKPYAMQVDGNTYYYITSLQGDVMGLVDASGNPVASYTYDPYGKVLTATGTLAEKNPLRYRGYYYDKESGLYYLLSRYYDPAVRRFVNADSYSSTGQGVLGQNMFAYCLNNPVDMSDYFGDWPEWVETTFKVVSAVVVVAAVVATVAAVSAATAGTGSAAAVYGASILLGAALSGINGGVANESKGNSYANGYLGGAAGGAIQATCSKSYGGTVIGGVAGVMVGTAITDTMNNLDPDSIDSSAAKIMEDVIISGGKAAVTSSMTSYMCYASDLAATSGANELMATYTKGFGEAVKAFFGWIDDAAVYLWG